MVTLLYRTLQSTLEYDTVIRRTWMMAAGRNFAFKIAAKPLQIKTRLLLETIQNYRRPFTTYRLATNTIHALQTYRQQTDNISYPRLDLTVGQKRN